MPARRRRPIPRERRSSPATANSRLPTLAAAIAGLACLTLLVFAPVRGFSFVNYDDMEFVVDNPHVATGLTLENVRWAFTHPYVAAGGPITWLSHLLDVELAGLDPGTHHVTSLVLHTINAVLLLVVLWRMTGALWTSAAVAALFAVHPLHVESVAWVAQRKDLLSALFWWLSIWAYTAYVRRPRAVRYLAVVALCALALMSKPVAVTLPATLLILDFWPLGRLRHDTSRRERWRILLEKLPLVLLAAIASAITYFDQRSLGAIAEHVPTSGRVANAVVSYAAYLGRTVWPEGLVAYYPYRFDLPWPPVAASLALLVAITAAAIAVRRRLPYVLAGWTWFIVTLLPSIGIVQAGGHAMADRATYVPLVGLFVVVCWGTRDLVERLAAGRLMAAGVAAAIVTACSVAARAQVMHWRDSVSLWQHATEMSPESGRAHANLGAALAADDRISEAIPHYREALRLTPGVPEVHNNLGLALGRTGRVDEAVMHYREAVRLDPRYARAHNNLGSVLAGRGEFDAAATHFAEAVRIEPSYAAGRVNLAVALAESGRLDEAVSQMIEAVRSQPGNAQWNYLAGWMLLRAGRHEEGRAYLRTALRLDPSHEAARLALLAADQK